MVNEEMGGCGIAIKKRCSPIVMLLMMESSQDRNVTLSNDCFEGGLGSSSANTCSALMVY